MFFTDCEDIYFLYNSLTRNMHVHLFLFGVLHVHVCVYYFYRSSFFVLYVENCHIHILYCGIGIPSLHCTCIFAYFLTSVQSFNWFICVQVKIQVNGNKTRIILYIILIFLSYLSIYTATHPRGYFVQVLDFKRRNV